MSISLDELRADFAIDDFDYLDTAEMSVVGPDGSATSATITFAGPAHARTRAQLRRLNEGRTANPRTLAGVEHQNVLFVVERIVTWSGIKRRDGEELVDVPIEDAMQVLKDPRKGWLFAQCFEFLATPRSFLPSSGEAPTE